AEHPAITLEIVAEDSRQDINSGRIEAGVRVGEFIEQDMLAVRLADEFRMIAVASPKYLEQHPVPLHPDDLRDHNCIRHRWSSDAAMHPWSFQRGNETIDVAVDGQLVVNDLHLALYAARDGAGVAYLPEAFVCPYFNAGLLVRLLDDWSHTRSGVFLYYSGRRHVPAPLQAFIGYVRRRGNAKKTSTETASRNGRASPYDETLARASIIGGTAMGGAPNGGARID
ncbi:MAG: LysR substrate-binding domain-containing protein, partial [Variibacter sp.]